ncbi:MAG: hypothetical protein COB22_07765 [Cycloclasticus sp.]|nr:MAG: hypothetical protein COB22_07765 [Cycloclasticus sp.]
MHILIIPSWYPRNLNDIGGSFFREQALELKKQGHEVGVLSLQHRPLRDLHFILFGKRNTSFEVDEGLLTYRKNGVKWLGWAPRLHAWWCEKELLKVFERYVKKHGMPDIIHVHSMLYAGCAAMAIYKKHGVPYVITEHSSAFQRGLVISSQKIIAEKVSQNALKRFAVSRPFADFLSEYFLMSGGKWLVMPNMVNDRFFECQIKDEENKSEFVFINIALLTVNKGVGLFLNAFAKAFPNNTHIKLKIGGYGKEWEALQKLSRRLGISDRVVFLGELSRQQVMEQVSASDVFVLSSHYETFGVVVIESLALGVPVIATRCGGPEDIIRKDDGMLVPVNDIDALAAAMVKMYDERAQFDGAKIRAACHARYSGEVLAERLAQVYADVLDGKS